MTERKFKSNEDYEADAMVRMIRNVQSRLTTTSNYLDYCVKDINNRDNWTDKTRYPRVAETVIKEILVLVGNLNVNEIVYYADAAQRERDLKPKPISEGENGVQ